MEEILYKLAFVLHCAHKKTSQYLILPHILSPVKFKVLKNNSCKQNRGKKYQNIQNLVSIFKGHQNTLTAWKV